MARAPDLIHDLLEKGRIDVDALEPKPLTIAEDQPILELVEQLRAAPVPMAIVRDAAGALKGVVTSTDLLQTIVGKG